MCAEQNAHSRRKGFAFRAARRHVVTDRADERPHAHIIARVRLLLRRPHRRLRVGGDGERVSAAGAVRCELVRVVCAADEFDAEGVVVCFGIGQGLG